jgi:hypothetical protein
MHIPQPSAAAARTAATMQLLTQVKTWAGQKSFLFLLLVSLLDAATGFWWGPGRGMAYVVRGYVPEAETIQVCDDLAVVWLVIFLASQVVYRKRALWQLLGAPFVLLWPVGFAVAEFVRPTF